MLLKKRYRIMLIVLGIIIVIAAAIALYMQHPKFGRAPRGERLTRIERSPNYMGGQFRNEHPMPQMTSGKGRARTMFDFLFEKRERNRPESALPAVKTDLKGLNLSDEVMIWFGHSSYFIQSGGRRILIDPVFEDASPVSFFNKPFAGTDVYKAENMPDIDYLIITHDHWDHLDYTTLKKLHGRIGRVVCPLGVGEYFEQWGFDTALVSEMDWYDSISFPDGYKFHCLPTHHFSGRTFASNRTLWASFMVETPSKIIYAGGDGGYGVHFAEIARRFPRIDLALIENGQYNKDWRYIHLMPDDLIKAVRDLSPTKVLAGHNSKYALSKHPWDEPMNNITASGCDSLGFITPRIGQPVDLNDNTMPSDRWWTEIN